MNKYNITVHSGETVTLLCADGEKSISESLGSAHTFSAPCGGRGRCRKCVVEIRGLLRSNDDEVFEANGRYLACQHRFAGDCELWLGDFSGLRIVGTGEERLSGGGKGLGLAVDIGTTTVAASVFDLETGKKIAEKAELNAQRSFGADVISRMEHCRRGKAAELFEVTKRQLAELAPDNAAVTKVVLVGNTVMQHLAAGLDPSGMSIPPFTPESLFGEYTVSDIWPNASVYYAPCVSAYVGGDIPAGMLACGLDKAEGTQLYVDIGTNGEIAIGDSGGYMSCATAAGPAFEGAEIACGMNAAEGAVDRVFIENNELRCHVIGGGEAKGICGSGLIDAVAVLLDLNIIGKSGRFVQADKAPEALRERFISVGGVRAFRLSGEVYISAQDIRKVQLAKAAIRAGIETVLDMKKPERITVAGGFGKYIDVKNAMRIGLLPDFPAERVIQAGNAAARGAVMLLEEGADRITALHDLCRYTELSSSEKFSGSYIEYLNF